MKEFNSSSAMFKNYGNDQLVLDMSRTHLVATKGALLPSTYAGFSVITFPSLSKLARIRSHVGDSPSTTSASEPSRIMIVDDERDITMVFKPALERAGFKVEAFNNPLEALSHFKPDYYDLILLDVRMPKMNGFELYGEIIKQDKNVKACFISAFEVLREELKKYAPEKDEECVIKKPVSTRELVRIIKEELE